MKTGQRTANYSPQNLDKIVDKEKSDAWPQIARQSELRSSSYGDLKFGKLGFRPLFSLSARPSHF